MSMSPRLLVTGASGQLGQLVIQTLLKSTPASRIVAGMRNPASDAGKALAVCGVEVVVADYDRPEILDTAFKGIGKALLISSNEVGKRVPQHKGVIAAAKRAGVSLLAYTSTLYADTSTMVLANEHRATEEALCASGVPFALLRNSWYIENHAMGIPPALAHGAMTGAAGEGRFSSAARIDYAEAAAVVLLSDKSQAGRIYELAGDNAYTLAQFAAEVARQTGKPVAYKNLSEADYTAALVGAGFPEPFAAILADTDIQVQKGALYNDSHHLSALIGRPTTPYGKVIADELAAK